MPFKNITIIKYNPSPISMSEELVDLVKQWIQYDEELKAKKKEVKTLREKQKELTNSLSLVMDSKNIDGLNLNDKSRLIYKKQKVKGGLTKKLLNQTLAEFFEDDELSGVIQHIMSQRTEKILNNIERKS